MIKAALLQYVSGSKHEHNSLIYLAWSFYILYSVTVDYGQPCHMIKAALINVTVYVSGSKHYCSQLF